MRLTRTGAQAFLLLLLALAAALASGNNLLYLLYALVAAALAVSAAGARPLVEADVELPEGAFQGAEVPLVVRLRNPGRFERRALRLRWGGSVVRIASIGPRSERRVELRVRLPHRGLNRLAGLRLESAWPFGLVLGTREVAAAPVLALPRPGESGARSGVLVESADAGAARPKKGAGDDLYGIREYDESDDPRLINWKLSARTGRLLVNEFAEPGGAKVLVRLPESRGAEAEERVREAAAACRLHIERGAEVRLVAGPRDTGFGRGRLHLERMLEALALLGEGGSPREARSAEDPGAEGAEPGLLWPTYLGALVVWASLFLIEEIPRPLLAGLLPLLGLGAWLDLRGGPRLPGPLWNAASLCVLLFVLLFDWRRSGVVVANTHLLIYLLVNRTLCPKDGPALRQFFLILFLAFFLVSGQTISLWYVPAFLAYAAAAALWLSQAGGSLRPLLRPLAFTLAAAGLLFLATPRIEPLRRMNPFVAMGLDKRAPRREFVSGFTERVRLGFFGQLKKSSARVMRVRPLDAPQTPPPWLRVRGAAFDRFDGIGWSASRLEFRYRLSGRTYWTAESRAWLPRRGSLLLLPGSRPLSKRLFEFTLYPLNSSVLFTPDDEGLPAAVEETDNGVYFDASDSLRFGASYLNGIRYLVRCDPSRAGSGPAIVGYDAIVRERFLQLPALDPRIPELAERITRRSLGPAEKVAAVERFLSRGFDYSLYSDEPDRTLSDFLFRVHSGNCEYFATAAAVLLRSAGVPTRLVTGFLADEWNEYGRFYDVRQGMAHAWVEAWVDGRWATVEATPSENALSQRAGDVLERARRWFDAVQTRWWYRHVIGYDSFVQRNTFRREALALELQRAGRALRRHAGPAAAAGVLLLLVWGLSLLLRLPRRPPTPYERAERLLARKGLSRKPWQTPREFLAEASAARPALAAARELAELHYAQRWSGRALTADERRRAQALLEAVREALR
ncbi:MAG TPA: hypothetical protein DCM05_08890 [Elusimicrobia bacterium]|nr:hypothetical protein [Elusimicrobiota bacterium]